MSVTNTRYLLRTRFDAGCDAAGIAPELRDYEGTAFVPPDPVALYARETLIPGAETVVAAGEGTPRMEEIGIYAVEVFSPAGVGTRDLDDAVEALRAQFRPGSSTNVGTDWVEIQAASTPRLANDDRVVRGLLSVQYRARRAT